MISNTIKLSKFGTNYELKLLDHIPDQDGFSDKLFTIEIYEYGIRRLVINFLDDDFAKLINLIMELRNHISYKVDYSDAIITEDKSSFYKTIYIHANYFTPDEYSVINIHCESSIYPKYYCKLEMNDNELRCLINHLSYSIYNTLNSSEKEYVEDYLYNNGDFY